MGSPARRLTNPITRCWDPTPSPLCRDRRQARAPTKPLMQTTYADVRMSGGRPISRHVAVGWHGVVPCAVAATFIAACPGNPVCLSGIVGAEPCGFLLRPVGLPAPKGPSRRVAWQMSATQDGRYRHRPDTGCAIRSRRGSCSHPVRVSSSDRTGRRHARNTSPSGAPVDQTRHRLSGPASSQSSGGSPRTGRTSCSAQAT
jgi:hypothetical protein